MVDVVRVAIPVLRGKVMVLVDKGRPWSVIEHLILEALAKREWTASDLAQSAKLPRRVVVESIIRLMRAGWVDMAPATGSISFQANPYGIAAATKAELPAVGRRMRRPIGF